jgi:hypothetical protein
MPSRKSSKSKAKRPSPSDHAGNHKNKIMIGNDGNEYVSKPDKNDVYHWKKITDKNCVFEYFDQFPDSKPMKYNYIKIVKELRQVAKDLEKYNIFLFNVKWKNIHNDIDLAWNDAIVQLRKKEFYKKETKKLPPNERSYNEMDFSFLFYTEHDLYFSSINGQLNLQHNIQKSDMENLETVLKKHFGRRVISPKSNKSTIKIKLDRI